MEIKEAIERLKEYHDNSVIFSETVGEEKDDFAVALEIAISALEKQIGKKPLQNEIEYPYMQNMVVAQCPSCHRRLRTKRTMAKGDGYCPECGQKIDWTE